MLGSEFGETDQCRSQTAHDLDRSPAELPDFVEGKGQVVLPRRHGKDEAKHTIGIAGIAGIELDSA